MAEGFEKTTFQEAVSESAVGKAVRGAIAEVQQTNKEYWDIRQDIEGRKNASGKGVYKHYVENMDKILHHMYAGKELGAVGKVAEFSQKVGARVEAAVVSFGAATLDIPYNVLTWLPRKMSPFGPPKDVFKRLALARFDIKLGLRAAGAGIVRGELSVAKAVRTGAEAVMSAPEVAVRMAKKKVDRVVNWIKSPFAEGKPSTPKARP
jgi:hypothetical protein